MPRHLSQPTMPLAEAQAALAAPPPGFTYPLHLKLTLRDAEAVARLKNAAPNALGEPFLGLHDVITLALDVAANLAKAGELNRWRTPPPDVGLAPLPEPTAEQHAAALAWVETFRADAEARAASMAKTLKAARRDGAGRAGKPRR